MGAPPPAPFSAVADPVIAELVSQLPSLQQNLVLTRHAIAAGRRFKGHAEPAFEFKRVSELGMEGKDIQGLHPDDWAALVGWPNGKSAFGCGKSKSAAKANAAGRLLEQL